MRPHILAISPGDGFEPGRWRAVLHSGIDALMIREKHLETRALLDLVRRVQDLAPEVALWVNGRLDVALRTGTGFHAPERHPHTAVRGLSLSLPIHEASQSLQRCHADQWLVSPIFPVPQKGEPWGIPRFLTFLDTLESPHPSVLALGGVDPTRAAALRHPRLAGIAMIRALWQDSDPSGCVARLRQALS